MKATEQYIPVVLFILLCQLFLTFESVDEMLKYNHSNESYSAVLSCGAICFFVLYKVQILNICKTHEQVSSHPNHNKQLHGCQVMLIQPPLHVIVQLKKEVV